MARQFFIDIPLSQATEQLQNLRVKYHLLGTVAIAPRLIAADAEQVAFEVVGGMRLGPLLWLPTSRIQATLARKTARESVLIIRTQYVSVGQVALWVVLITIGLVMLRLRLWVGIPAIVAIFGWIDATLTITLSELERTLVRVFGVAVSYKRD